MQTILRSDNPFVLTWPAGKGPAADVKFKVDSTTKSNGLRVVRDDEKNGLRLAVAAGFVLIVR